EERLAAGHPFHVIDVRAAGLEHGELAVAKVIAHRTDDVDLVQQGGSQGEVRGSAPHYPLTHTKRRCHRVKRDRPHHRHAHAATSCWTSPAASRSASASSVRSHVKSGSSRPK